MLELIYFLDIFLILVMSTCIALGAVIFWKRTSDRVARYLAYYTILNGVWVASIFYGDIALNIETLVFWTKVSAITALLFTVYFTLFTITFRNHSARLIRYVPFFIPAIVMIIYIMLLDPNQVYSVYEFYYNKPPAGILADFYNYYLLLVLGYYICSYWILLRKRKTLPALIRNQIRYIILGFSIAIGSGFLFNGILPAFGIANLYAVGVAFSIFLVACTTYAIVKHQLLDFKILVQRGLIFTLLLALIVGVYLLGIFMLGLFVQGTTHVTTFGSALITTLVGIFGVPPLEKRFRKITDRFFFKHTYSYSHALNTISEMLNHTLDLETLLSKMTKTLTHILKIETIGIAFIHDGTYFQNDTFQTYEKKTYNKIQQYLDAVQTPLLLNGPLSDITDPEARAELKKLTQMFQITLLIPIIVEQKKIATLYLGNKKSGDMYTPEDIQLLQTVAHQAAVAIQKAQLYEEVKEYSETLEEKVIHRTEKIKQLQEQQKQLMIDISHNLQTPLTIVKGELGILKKEVHDTHALNRFEKSIDKISQFIYSLLRASTFESEEQTVDIQTYNLSSALEAFIEYITTLAEDKQITLTHHIAHNIHIDADQGKIEEVLTNIVSNAFKYIAHEKKVSIELSQKNNQACIVITDTGIGMDKKELHDVFQRYYRADTEDKVIKGTGLGLAISKHIIEKHHGTISVSSTKGRGTTVEILLPLKQPHDSRK